MATAQELQQKVGMRPTLLVGLGGSGQKVLVQLKARFLRTYGQVPPAVEFLAFDTDPSGEQAQVEGKVITLTPDTELVNIGGVDTAEIIRNLDRHPAIAAWLGEDKDRIPKQALVQGARMVRPLGRLSLFWNVELIVRKLQASVQRLTDLKLSNDQKGVNVFIISSVCGGTGAGTFLDLAFLARHVIERSGLESSFCYINGILALPSVFPKVPDRIGIQANAYAALAELDYFTDSSEGSDERTHDWYCDYGNPRVPTVEFQKRAPFSICYLVDARNEQGQGLNGLEEIAPMLAEAVYLQISSQVGRANASAFDNVLEVSGFTLQADEGKLRPTAYSSLGTSSLVFPAPEIISLCAHRLGRDLIQHGLLRSAPAAAQTNAAVAAFLDANELKPDTLLGKIARDAKNNVMRVVLDARALDRYKESEVFSATQAYLQKAENTVDNEFTQILEQNRKNAGEKLAAAMGAEADRLADDPANGVNAGIAFLERLAAVLAETRSELDKSRADMDTRKERAQAALRQTQEAYAASFRAMPFGRGAKIKEARNRHVEMFQNYLAARFESRKREMAITLLAGLATSIQEKRIALQRLLDRLQVIQGQFEAYVGVSGQGKPRTDFVLAQDITDDVDIDRYYAEHLARLGDTPAAALVGAEGPLHIWPDLAQEEVADRILRYCKQAFADLGQITVEQIVLEKKDQVEPRERLQNLVKRSVPFWMFKTAGVLGQDWAGAHPIIVVGVPDRERSIYRNAMEEGQSLTSTFDPHKITVMQTKHGVPLFALTQYRDFRQAHDHVLRQGSKGKPLYLFPEVRPGGEKAKQVFALGIAYGFVFKSGTFYFILPADPGHPPIQLEQGMGDSLASFRNSDVWINHVTRMVEEQISREGSAASIDKLEGFVREPYVYELKGGARVTNVDRSTMTPDLSVGRPGSANFDRIKELRDAIKEYLEKVLRG